MFGVLDSSAGDFPNGLLFAAAEKLVTQGHVKKRFLHRSRAVLEVNRRSDALNGYLKEPPAFNAHKPLHNFRKAKPMPLLGCFMGYGLRYLFSISFQKGRPINSLNSSNPISLELMMDGDMIPLFLRCP